MSTTYAGYKPYHIRESLLTWQPGQNRAVIDNKYHSDGYVYQPTDAAHLTASVYGLTTSNLSKSDFHVQESKNEVRMLPMEKPTAQHTEMGAMYPSYPGEAQLLRSVSAQAYEVGFMSVDRNGEGIILPKEIRMVLRVALHTAAEAAEGAAKTAAASQKGLQLTAAAKTTERHILEPPDHLVNIFTGICERREVSKLTLPEFLDLVAEVADNIEEDLAAQVPATVAASTSLALRETRMRSRSPGRTTAAMSEAEAAAAVAAAAAAAAAAEAAAGFDTSVRHLTAAPLQEAEVAVKGLMVSAMRKAQIEADSAARGIKPALPGAADGTLKLIGPQPTSSFLRDIGPYGSDPRSIPIVDPISGGIPQTTRELGAGTTRTSRHVPGYTGTVPAVTTGAAAEQGLGQTARDVFHAKNNLSQTYTRRVPGYTGFLPSFSVFESSTVNKPRGAAANSDYDRAGGALESYWLSESQRVKTATMHKS